MTNDNYWTSSKVFFEKTVFLPSPPPVPRKKPLSPATPPALPIYRDGFSLMKDIRQIKDIPILFLTARDKPEDMFTGLDAGGDDYMTKPFLPKELLLRLSAILRRSYKNEKTVIELAHCTIDFDKAEINRQGETFPLTAREHAILNVLYKSANRIVTMDALCAEAWGDNLYGYENSLMAHIRRIREKIEMTPSSPESLITIKGLGYKLIL